MRTQTTDEQVRIPAGSIVLSGILTYPAAGSPVRSVLLCAPHPHFAGDMDNNVVRALAAALAADGAAVLRFDYRGIGDSEIDLPEDASVFDYWEEIETRQNYSPVLHDVRAAAQALSDACGELPLTVAGYSFGAVLGCMYACEAGAAECVVGVSPPLARVSLNFLECYREPCLLLSGADDFACPPAALAELAARGRGRIHTELLAACDHFFRGQEEIVCEHVAAFVDRCGRKRTRDPGPDSRYVDAVDVVRDEETEHAI